jgi:spore germination protein KC
MRALKRVLVMLLVVALLLPASGCWDYNEIEDMLFVAGIAYDRAPSGKLRSTIEVSTVMAEGESAKPEYLEVEGDTFYDTFRNTIKIADKPLYWSHAEVVIVSQDIARKEMSDLVDMLLRLPQMRVNLAMLVSKEGTAGEVLEAQNPAKSLNSLDILGSLKAERQLEKSPYIQLYQFADAMADESQSAVLPAVGLGDSNGQRIVEISGSAVFNGPWLQGFLDEFDTRSFMMLDYGKDLYDLPLPADFGGKFSSASVQFFLKRVEIYPDFTDGKAKVDIYIQGEIIPVEISGASTDPAKFKTVTDAILTSTCTAVENAVPAMISHTKDLNGADVMSIGNRLKDRMPETWRQICGHWRDYYKDMQVTVRVGIKLRNTGVSIAPLTKGD